MKAVSFKTNYDFKTKTTDWVDPEEFEIDPNVNQDLDCEEAISIEIAPGRWLTFITSEWATVMISPEPNMNYDKFQAL